MLRFTPKSSGPLQNFMLREISLPCVLRNPGVKKVHTIIIKYLPRSAKFATSLEYQQADTLYNLWKDVCDVRYKTLILIASMPFCPFKIAQSNFSPPCAAQPPGLK